MGKGHHRRKGADDDAYRRNYERIFGNVKTREQQEEPAAGNPGALKEDTGPVPPETAVPEDADGSEAPGTGPADSAEGRNG
jgi:hypothetical protein